MCKTLNDSETYNAKRMDFKNKITNGLNRFKFVAKNNRPAQFRDKILRIIHLIAGWVGYKSN